ncbi:hypothetical protein XfCFBP8082_10110 [Xylella fastidiosa subsp. fastidiosa]|jgi:hypothetical protein|uniref:Uncharacterized protein n=1 Tax=Xylella fastidiosa subsp. sandyi Ann-1 TaxID=155920 RepID=A0A060H3Z8_XYLFS|nr:hypothetical protein D934_09800 [Xylella fastidiosa subsp. sandyi Ann-1]AIC13672.1 hypothetical protein P303_04335 [Xylella fastidiosa MUL0034]EGO81796.1 hypothetical protein XFEB_01272 [Xylella fastidiosa EB92.1]EWG14257.1 hypothetical protein P910_002462 [Xylella fastidiosa Mul-MD]KAF0572080.1 hypothetical protein P305_01650 [Xylella fastidiosa subsp. fastidiosa Mus-1]KGM21030.1 hypothetical protein JT24_04625 [Xylella fastidiosa]RUA37265.1 hypothetical protein DX878_06320 [Xylella fasti
MQDALFSGAPLHFEGCSKRFQGGASNIGMVQIRTEKMTCLDPSHRNACLEVPPHFDFQGSRSAEVAPRYA